MDDKGLEKEERRLLLDIRTTRMAMAFASSLEVYKSLENQLAEHVSNLQTLRGVLYGRT